MPTYHTHTLRRGDHHNFLNTVVLPLNRKASRSSHMMIEVSSLSRNVEYWEYLQVWRFRFEECNPKPFTQNFRCSLCSWIRSSLLAYWIHFSKNLSTTMQKVHLWSISEACNVHFVLAATKLVLKRVPIHFLY